MDEKESKKILSGFWDAYAEGDLDGCNRMFQNYLEGGDFDTMATAAQMSLVADCSDIVDPIYLLVRYFDPEETNRIIRGDADSIIGVLLEAIDSCAERGCACDFELPYDTLDSAVVTPGRMFLSNDLLSMYRAAILEKIKRAKTPSKTNIYLSAYVDTMPELFIYQPFDYIYFMLAMVCASVQPVVSRKTMQGHTAYAESIIRASKELRRIIAEALEKETPHTKVILGKGTAIDPVIELMFDLAANVETPLDNETIDSKCREYGKILEEHLKVVEIHEPSEEDIEEYLRMMGEDDDAEDDEDEGSGEDTDKDGVLDGISLDELGPKTPRQKLQGIAECDPEDAEQTMKVCTALVLLNRLEPAYSLFSEKCDQIDGLESRTSELGMRIADFLAHCYLHTHSKPTYGHVDILADNDPGGAAEFFMRFGERLMTHLDEAHDAIEASDLPDVYAMYSRFIFDCCGCDRIDALFADVAKAYGKTSDFILRNKRRMGPRFKTFISLCEHSRKVYEGMSSYLAKNIDGDHVYFDAPPIIAGHDFDHAFNTWFQSRMMQGAVIPQSFTDWAIRHLNHTIKTIIYDDFEDIEDGF